MSRYIRLLNHLKTSLAWIPLTPSQTTCRAQILERLAYPGIVNLYGLPGAGKTVLGWVLAQAGQCTYIVEPTPQLTPPQNSIVFLDNALSERAGFRRQVSWLDTARSERAVVVTRAPVEDYVFRIELELTAEDVQVAMATFARLGYPSPERPYSTLWHLLAQLARGSDESGTSP